ncbi:MAG: hypothetical protein U0744_03080 [Gemmataceae bacterium]
MRHGCRLLLILASIAVLGGCAVPLARASFVETRDAQYRDA